MKLVVKNSLGETVSLQIRPEDTFVDLKERVEDEAGISLDLNDIATNGKIIDTQKVIEYFLTQNTAEDALSDDEADVNCAVPGCPNTKLTRPDKVFFDFPQLPQEEIRCHQWVLYCQRLSMASGKHRINLSQDSAICSDHFRPDQFVKNTTTLLKRTAVPCINPELPAIGAIIAPKGISTPKPVVQALETTTYEHLSEVFPPLKGEKCLFCRLCANLCSDVVFIYSAEGRKLGIAEKINSCLPVKVAMTDSLPKQVCKECIFELDNTKIFSEICSTSDEDLKRLLMDRHFISGSSLLSNSSFESHKTLSMNPCHSSKNNSFVDKLSNVSCPLCLEGQFTECEMLKCEASESEFTEKDIPAIDSPDFSSDCLDQLPSNIESDLDFRTSLPIIEEEEEVGTGEGCGLGELGEHDIEKEEDDNENFTCKICGLEFLEQNELIKHELNHDEDTTLYHCSQCENYYDNCEELEEHMTSHKSNPVTVYDKDLANTCEKCLVTFKNMVQLASHSCIFNSNKCHICQKTFRSEARLHFHMKFHRGAKPGFCDICKKTFTDEVKLYKHTLYRHSSGRSHKCDDCSKVFRSQSSLKYHQRSHLGENYVRPYSCDWCGKNFITKNMLRSHVSTTHKNMTQESSCFTCKICFEAFPSTTVAVAHMDVKHKEECMDGPTYSFEMHTVTRVYICEFCEKSFAEGATLNKHREVHISEIPYECKYCGQTFSSLSEHHEHKESHSDQEVPLEYTTLFSVPQAFLCEYCDRCFLNYIKFSEHLTIHYRPEPYLCRYCNARFKTLEEVTNHRVAHGSPEPYEEFNFYRPYECHYCIKSFAIEDALIKHIRMHTGEKPFICDQCGKGFSQSSGLYTHQKVHSDERPYNCPLCTRTFKIKGDRDVHVRKHSGDRPYKCEFCGKAFMTQHVYSQHRKIHTGERPYKCDVCGISFRRSHVLTVHKRIHTGEKPNVCDICGKSYRQKGDMLKHRRIQHGFINR